MRVCSSLTCVVFRLLVLDVIRAPGGQSGPAAGTLPLFFLVGLPADDAASASVIPALLDELVILPLWIWGRPRSVVPGATLPLLAATFVATSRTTAVVFVALLWTAPFDTVATVSSSVYDSSV